MLTLMQDDGQQMWSNSFRVQHVVWREHPALELVGDWVYMPYYLCRFYRGNLFSFKEAPIQYLNIIEKIGSKEKSITMSKH